MKVYATMAAVLARTAVWFVYREAKSWVCRHTFYAYEPFGPDPIIRCTRCGRNAK